MGDTASKTRSIPLTPGAGDVEKPRSDRTLPGNGGPLPVRDDQPTIITGRQPLPAPAATSDSAYRILQGRIMPGDRLEHFELVEYVGGGGMGRVFRALDTRLARPVALKILAPDQAVDQETRLRFQNEAQSAARLDHENIARVFHVGEDRGLHYIVFEYIEGINIRALVEQKGPLSLEEAVNYTLQIAEALAHAAGRDVVHRDIKPSNVLIAAEGRVKLIDMGLARLRQADPAVADLTASGVTLGTFDYISPEQARDPRNADVRSDIYSLGCTFFYMLSGRPPFPEGTVLQKLLQHQGDQPPDVHQFRPDLPDEVTRVLRKMLAKDPRHRYANPAELVDDLLTLAEQVGLPLVGLGGKLWLGRRRIPAFSWRRHLPWVIPAAALLCIVLLLDLVWSLEARRDDRLPPSLIGAPEGEGSGQSPPEDYSTQPPDRRDDGAGRKTEDRRGEGVLPAGNGGDSRAPSGLGTDLSPAGAGFGSKYWDGTRTIRTATEGLNLETLHGGAPVDGGSGLGPTLTDYPGLKRLPGEPASLRVGGAPGATKRTGLLVVEEKPAGENHFSSLAAACAAAVNGDIIELCYNGPRKERPISLANLHVTIRAGKGFQPVVLFQPTERDPYSGSCSLFHLTSGRLTLRGIGFELRVSQETAATSWSLVEIRGPQTVRGEKCILTICNADEQKDVVFFRTRPTVEGEPAAGEAATAARATNIELRDCLARGDAVLLHVEKLQPTQLVWENGLLVTAQQLLTADGGNDVPRPGDMLGVDLRHVTAVVRGGLCRLIDESRAPQQLATQFRCYDCIILGTAAEPLIAQEGTAEIDVLRRRFTWNGERNFYQGFDQFWIIDDADAETPLEQRDFTAWQAYWTAQGEQRPSTEPVVWRKLPDPERPLCAHTAEDYQLDKTVDNPAINAVNDSGYAGFLSENLPPAPPTSTSTEKPATKTPPADLPPAEKTAPDRAAAEAATTVE
jgi:serine/threonine-protein kinase